MNRRQILVTTGAIAALATGTSAGLLPAVAAAQTAAASGDRVLGAPDAPIEIVEYASLTCPHCARFHADTLPSIKKNWIEPGKARLVYRDYPLDGLALQAAALARCFEGDRYFGFLDALFRSQQQWARDSNPQQALKQIAALAGLDGDEAERCMNDADVQRQIIEGQRVAANEYGIRSTPSVMINGKLFRGAATAENLHNELTKAGSS
ncbi:MAG: DsbA family protein [Pseudomonadota bacterium]